MAEQLPGEIELVEFAALDAFLRGVGCLLGLGFLAASGAHWTLLLGQHVASTAPLTPITPRRYQHAEAFKRVVHCQFAVEKMVKLAIGDFHLIAGFGCGEEKVVLAMEALPALVEQSAVVDGRFVACLEIYLLRVDSVEVIFLALRTPVENFDG